ncbi:hypothetical protein FQN53_005982 [Emmonsiellopsis sp. PD_33]|nr:hypothetical protein FQN53_005982 [Emmonsiellopsis sp. PD_33]
MGSDIDEKNALAENFNVDHVVLYRFANVDKSEAIRQFKRLIRALTGVGLQTEVRPGPDSSLLVFVKAQNKHLGKALYRSRVKDWLHGIHNKQPDVDEKESCIPESDAERLLIVYNMITLPTSEGGAGITPKHGEWDLVDSIFPLHDKALNKAWIKAWSSKTLLTPEDLDEIRNHHGEKMWKRQEGDLRIRWKVKNVSEIRTRRREFKYEKTIIDAVTGEEIPYFPATTRLWRQLLQIPFAAVAVLALGTLIATCFAIEIFISEVYAGPFKSYLRFADKIQTFIPTIILSLCVPTISTILTNTAIRLTDYENYETQDSYDFALTNKIFVLNFITSYLPVLLTAFVYAPFGTVIVPYLDVFHLTVKPFVSEKSATTKTTAFQINPARLRKQVIYFTVTAQIVNFAMETIVPYAKRKFFLKYQEYTEEQAKKNGSPTTKTKPVFEDAPGEADFLTRIRHEAQLSEYDVSTDFREMVVQFGYLSLFSVVWPLVPVSFLINNWIELRSDFVKICIECRRPVPFRCDTIGSWVQSIEFLSWFGSITTAALVYMFSNDGVGPDGNPSTIRGWVLLVVIFFSEHLYLLVRLGVQVAISKIETPATRHERAQRYLIRKQYFDTTLALEKSGADSPTEAVQSQLSQDEQYVAKEEESITRASLEEDARRFSQHDSSPSDLFWARQRGWRESSFVGEEIIDAELSTKAAEKKAQ